ncbi:hypothetical protein HMPREF9148_01916 [Prevotella sp. F0091]|nr:hypothetical protein HMPREF9148_01916 [Prevotella sp. F0091]
MLHCLSLYLQSICLFGFTPLNDFALQTKVSIFRGLCKSCSLTPSPKEKEEASPPTPLRRERGVVTDIPYKMDWYYRFV